MDQILLSTPLDKLGGRKFILGVMSLIVLVALAVVKPEAVTIELVSGMLGLVGIFTASNTTTTIKAMNKMPQNDTPTAPPNTLQEQLDAQQNQLDQLTTILLKLTSPAPAATVVNSKKEQIDANRAILQQSLT